MLKQLDATLRERYSKDGVRQAMLGTLNVDVDRLDKTSLRKVPPVTGRRIKAMNDIAAAFNGRGKAKNLENRKVPQARFHSDPNTVREYAIELEKDVSRYNDRLDDPLKSRGEALQKNRLKNLVDDNRLAAFSLKDSKSHFEKAIPDSNLSAAEKKACAKLIQAVRNIDVADGFALNGFQRMEPAKGIVQERGRPSGPKDPDPSRVAQAPGSTVRFGPASARVSRCTNRLSHRRGRR